MFYYLLEKSSFLKNQDTKIKQTSILIYGTIIYIILHLILNSFNKNMVQYFWVILGMDITVILLNTKVTTDLIFNKSNIKKVRFNDEVMEREIEPNKKINEVLPESDSEIINEIVNKDKTIKKKNSNKKNRKSTPIKDIINKDINKDIINKDINKEQKKINDTLDDIKMEDLVSDSGSDIDLESFEKDYFESNNQQ
jgi:hypothetical protein|uniref:Uncharacterized protein n=1 Tax=Mimiviridae sp. ChoanoV1 TaxID=2596887 RepID=A0A5B8IG45_9VIRU|nr:hypothetical protein 10_9 [Mimiviridae sp. ChoanoV1]